MKRLQIPLGFAAIVGICSILTLSFNKPIASNPSKATAILERVQPSAEDIAYYNIKKQTIHTIVSSYFKKAMANHEFMAAGVSVVQGDSILFADGFGNRHINEQQPVNAHTAFRLGSLSKGFAGVLSASIKQDGLIDYGDNIQSYLPNFQLGSNGSTKISIANILSHTSGTPYHSYTDLVESGMDLDDIAGRFKDVQSISKPGSLYSYQNALFAFSGKIIEKVTKRSFEKTIEQRLFSPLQMHDASTNHKDFIAKDNIAYPHQATAHSWRSIKLTDKYDNAVAAGGINASSDDMAKWMRFLLGHNPEVLQASALDEVFTPRVEIKGKRKYYQRWEGHQSSHYAFGWRIHSFKSAATQKERVMIHHGGSVNDYRNEIALFPEDDLGICVLFNSHTALAKTVIPELHDLIKTALTELESKKPIKSMVTLDSETESDQSLN